jgi:hypothetical protein
MGPGAWAIRPIGRPERDRAPHLARPEDLTAGCDRLDCNPLVPRLPATGWRRGRSAAMLADV